MATHLKKILENHLPAQELEMLEGSYDVVGDIAVVRIADSLLYYAPVIAEAILATNTRLKVVARREGKHGGEFRTTGLTVIGGENRTETEVREFGLRYRLDLAKCYFSVRSGAERWRIASLVKEGERVLVLFSGVAPFPLMIGQHSSAAEIVGIEKNSISHHFALQNRVHNRLEERVRLYCADVNAVLPELVKEALFHRLVMPLPVGGERFLAGALSVLRPKGFLHFYAMTKSGDVKSKLLQLQSIIAACGRRMEDISVVKAGHCGSRLFRFSFEGKII